MKTDTAVHLKYYKLDDSYLHLMERSPHIMFICQDDRIVFANRKARKTLGADHSSLLGKEIKDFVRADFQEMIEQEEDATECSFQASDGNVFFLEVNGTKVTYNGRPAVLVEGQDVTSRRRLEEKLKASEQRCQTLSEQNAYTSERLSCLEKKIEIMRKGLFELNETIHLQQGMIFKFKHEDGRFIHTLSDGELLYRLGLTPSQVVGKELAEFLPEDAVKKKLEYYERAWNGEAYITYENQRNGIHYLTALTPVKHNGEVTEVIGSCVDITERKRVDKALQQSQERYRLIADNMSDLIGILDVNGNSLYASPSHETVLGYPPEFYEGKGAFETVHPDDLAFVQACFKEMVETKHEQKCEVHILHSNGEWKLLEYSGSPVLDENGEIKYFVVVGRDITNKRRAEEQLVKAEKLQLVGELAAGIAHEIRNPIQAIKGFVQLFQEGFIKDEYFPIILNEFNRIEEIIKEFLSLAKKQEMKLSNVEVPILIKEVHTLLESEANLRNVQFSYDIEPDVPRILCDPNHIKQVFINVIKNSIESIESAGLINIRVNSDQNHLVIKISDNGIGISKERLLRLGEPFFSTKEKGTGLGLMTTFKIIKQHNGMINITSEENIGTTVQINLPCSMNETEF